jgi:hypothetical protein
MKIVKLLPFPKIFGRLHHFDQIKKKHTIGVDCGFETGRITQTIKLIFVASPISTQN